MKTVNSLKLFLLPVPVLAVLLQMITFRKIPQEVCKACPGISDVSPDHGKGGDIVEITGINLGGFMPGFDKVTINEKEASFIEFSSEPKMYVSDPEKTLSGRFKIAINDVITEGILFSDKDTAVAPTLSRSNKAKATSHVQRGVSGVFIEQNRLLFDDKSHPKAIRFNQVADLKVKVPENAGSGPVCIIIDDQSVQGQVFTYEYASPESPSAVSGNKDPVDWKGRKAAITLTHSKN